MNARTHQFTRTIVAILCVALASVGFSATAFAAGGDALIRYLPNNTKGVVSVDVQKLRASGTLDALMQSTGASKQLASVNTQLSSVGFDPLKQIDRAVLQVSSFNERTEPLLIFEGNFPKAAIETALKDEAHATQKKIGDIVVYTQGKRGSLAFLSNNIAAMGPTAAVEAAASIAAGKATSKPASAIRNAIAKANESKNVWFVADLPNEYLDQTPFKGAKSLYGEADIVADLLLNIHAQMSSSDAADAAAKDAKKTLTDMSERDEIAAIGLAPVVQAVQVSSKKDTVHSTLKLDQKRFRRLLVTVATIIREQLQ